LSPVIETISGLRGIYPNEMNPEYAFKVTCKFGSHLGEGRVAIGMDTRASSQALAYAARAGLIYSGLDVEFLGRTTTPEVFRHVLREKLKGGVVVTASHNPETWNGLKFVREGRGLFESELSEVLNEGCRFAKAGSSHEVDSSKYYDELLGAVGEGRASGIRVGLDLGGGSACIHVPELFSRTGAEVFCLNGNPGIFTRKIDPTQDQLRELSKVMVKTGCEIGFAFDCDGDRLQVLDCRGRKLPPDYALLAALSTVPPGGSVAISVDTSDAVLKFARKRGLNIRPAPVGEANVVEVMLREGCEVGGEGSSAGVIDSRFSFCRDGLLVAMRIIGELSAGRGPDVEQLKEHSLIRSKVNLENRAGERVIERLMKKYPDALTVDGVKVPSDDGWFLIRPSRTEGGLRISVQSSSEAGARRLLSDVTAEVLRLAKEG
jgi:phosphomannomutase